MTLRESDDRIVPLKLEVQSGGMTSSNIDQGKAVRISRDSDWAPPVLCDGPSVLTRLYRSISLVMGVLDRTTLFSPRVRPRAYRQRQSVATRLLGRYQVRFGSRMLESGTSGSERGRGSMRQGSNLVTPQSGNRWQTGNTKCNLNQRDPGLLAGSRR
ncbi:hypothetical protein Q31b_52770 [Novipirellula aureliae]|uniref:Uncharacterized protein n=1 Tax=Novipirellula aureliae TaxID=2527966 RepID=A0A5C6DGZ8_9BACT|nr:hypothetical protein Q31b_52770 [Novipirellula aureliae]